MIKDYDLVIDYYPKKAYVLADVFSRKSYMTLAHICTCVPLLSNTKIMGTNLDYGGNYLDLIWKLWIYYIRGMFCDILS